jgi:hypothetical protein
VNAGLGNLDSLKTHLLAGTMQADTTFDAVIADLGLGVAALFDRHCNRHLAYEEHATQIFRGNRAHWYMRAYPVVAFEKTELRYFAADSWTNISGQPLAINEETGMLSFGYTLGVDPIQVRVTWTGGYWYEQLEPTDAGYPSQAPALVTACTALEPAKFALPADIRLAWLIQCREVWNKIDKLGHGLIDKPDAQSLTGSLELSPLVKETLRGYVRYQIT